ncbi:MAG: heavy-metal-associated domain-containing protein [Prolixibacteraceae bacterium]
MRNIIFIAVIFLIVSCRSGDNNNENSGKTEVPEVNLVTDTFYVAGMHCDMCISSIEKGVNELEGVEFVKASLNDSVTVVKYNAKAVNSGQIEKAIEKRGYTVQHEQ